VTRKDYEALARAFALAKPYSTGSTLSAPEVWQRLAENVANVLSADNTRFNRERFLAACNGDTKGPA
jgi:hypothetical protein